MRKYLLAGAALAVATAALPAVSMADEMKAPVTVTIGGRLFESLFIQNVTNQNAGGGTNFQSYNMQDYFRLYPAVDYTAPNGIHYGFKSELRWGGNGGAGNINRAYLFVKSDRMGTFSRRWASAIISSVIPRAPCACGCSGSQCHGR